MRMHLADGEGGGNEGSKPNRGEAQKEKVLNPTIYVYVCEYVRAEINDLTRRCLSK